MKMVKISVTVIIGLIFAKMAFAQEPAVPTAQPQAAQEQEQALASDEKITLDLQGVDINELFKMLSQKSGLTIITSPKVQGRVTVYLNNLSFEDALDVVITKQDLAYEKKENLIKVMTPEEYEAAYGKKFGEKKEVKTIKLQFAKPSNIFNLISTLKSSIGNIIVDDASGTVLLIDSPATIALIESAIKELDQPLATEVFDINYAKSADIKTHLESLITPGLGQVIIEERNNKAIVSDLPKRLAKIKEIISALDEESRQVLISGEIIEVTLSDKFSRGIDWEKVFSERALDGLDLAGSFATTLSNYQKISVGTLTRNNYKATLNFLQEFGDTKTLSRPRVVVVNKEEAKVLVGTREAYITQTQTQTDAVVTADTVNFIDVGVKLSVSPTIGKDGFITMKIKPEVSSVSNTLSTSEGSVPIVSTSETETVVKVKNGSTIMIAGLMKEQKSDTINGIPVLSRIPFIGILFGNRIKDPTKTELVIFLTPQIISGTGEILQEARNEK
jgi:type II secretory pathway component GspD/PulD (secretin)